MKNGDLDAEAFDEDESDDQEYDVELESEEEAATEPVARGKVLKKKRAASETDASSEEIAEEEQNSNLPIPSSHPHFKLKKREARKTDEVEREKVKVALNQASLIEQESDYAMPDIRLLQHGKGPSFEDQEREVRRKAVILEKTFREFGFKIKVVEIETGPVIAQYEIEMEAGLRLSKITNLADDLAIALRVPSVRIVAPIPGKCTVGIEIPNEQRMMVCLRDVMEESAGKTSKMKIPLFLGKDVSGNPMVADLAALPHLLIAGRTGTGKSVCLNAIITSILMTRRPDEVRMLMIDPKMVELSGYARLPHLMHPVVTDMRKAEAILAWAVDKMEERYALLARAGVRHLTSYNQLDEDELWSRMQIEDEDEKKEIPRSLPFIVIVADEMADLMMTAGKEVEQHIIRLAQKSRAVGIHLILATQKPTVDVITGLIKSNLPSRIAFQVASKTDSRVVLDENGADKLLGNGDMLFLGPGTSILMRGQGTYLSDEEIDMITDTVSTNHQSFAPELVNLKIEGGQTASNDTKKANQRDEEYEQAVDVVVREGRGSVSLIQRSLAIGYGKAARLVDFMAEDGIVGDYKGSKARDVLVSAEEWEQMKAKGDSPDDEPPSSPPKKPAKKGKSSKAAAKLMQAASSSFSATNAADDVDFDESAATLPPTKSRNRTVTLIDRDATDAYEEEISLDSDQEDQYEDEVIDAGDDDDADEYEAAYDDAEDDADVEYEAEDEYEDDEDEDEEYDEAEDEADDEYEDDVEYEDDEIEAWEVASESDDDDQYEAEDEYSDEEDSEYEEDDEYEYEDADAHDAESELGGKAAIPKPRLFRGNDDEEGEYWETA
jgi:S-DNA-T family DNA segregation ATPase FtsK/SpoIIIE